MILASILQTLEKLVNFYHISILVDFLDILVLLLLLPPPSSPPSSPAKHQTNIQQSWINAKSQDGFLDVDNILKDPRTTRDPLHMDNMIVPTRL